MPPEMCPRSCAILAPFHIICSYDEVGGAAGRKLPVGNKIPNLQKTPEHYRLTSKNVPLKLLDTGGSVVIL
jgi:hypothetical protein